MQSAMEHPGVVREYIEKGCIAGMLLDSLDPALFPEVHMSKFGGIPKSDPGSWRLTVDLSALEGTSVNVQDQSGGMFLSYIYIYGIQ